MILQVLHKKICTLNTGIEEHRTMSQIASRKSVSPSCSRLAASHFSVLETLDGITASMAVEVSRYLLRIIDRTDDRAVTVSARTIGSESGDILSHLIDVRQISEEEVTKGSTALVNLASFALHIFFVLLGPVLHVLDLNPTGFAAVLHKLLEISLYLVRSIKCSVTVLGK